MNGRHADIYSHPGHYLLDPYTWPSDHLKIQGQGHGQDQTRWSHLRPWVQSIFVSWQSDHFWGLRYSKFHIWPWKFKVSYGQLRRPKRQHRCRRMNWYKNIKWFPVHQGHLTTGLHCVYNIELTSGFVRFFGRRVPPNLLKVLIKGEKTVVLTTVGADLDQFAAILHKVEAVWGWKEK